MRNWREMSTLLLAAALISTWASQVLAADKKAKPAPDAKAAQAASASEKWNRAVAEVNGEQISREELAEELLKTFGKKQLDLMINRLIVAQMCRKAKVNVTNAQIEKHMQEQLKQLNVNKTEFIQRVLGEREMTYSQYIRDVIWPKLALKELAQSKVTVTEDDLQKAFEANYGAKVDARMLIVAEPRKAQELWEEINAEKDLKAKLVKFEDACKIHSIDTATRPYGGKTQPINKHTGFPQVEEAAFRLKEGELSSIMDVPEGKLILYCVARIPARTDVTMTTPISKGQKETVRDMLMQDMYEKKMQFAIANMFREERGKAKIQDYLTGDFDLEDQKAMGEPTKSAPAPAEQKRP